jgi:hypothetical protein
MWLAMASRKIFTRIPIVLEIDMIHFPTSPVKTALGP